LSISISFEELVASASDPNSQESKFDCLIIGSGYGGAVAARTFSRYQKTAKVGGGGKSEKEPLKIAVLERGKEYLPGSFPAGLNEVISTVNRPCSDTWSKPHDGLFDIRNSDTHWVIAGSGVGGGSLINAGVMLAPSDETLDDPAWPQEARDVLKDNDFMDSVGLLLGSRLPDAESGSIANTVVNAKVETNKYNAMDLLGGSENSVDPTPLSIRLSDDEPNQAAITSPCIQCGNCFSGCNFNAKKSLDTNLLVEAQQQGVTIVNGAEALYFEKQGHGWAVHVVYSSDKLRTTLIKPLKLYCDHLVVAAGSVGSTELLLRSQYKARHDNGGVRLFSTMLGKRFFGNGDTISSITGRNQPVTMVASDATEDANRNIGPTNSGMLNFPGELAKKYKIEHRFILQELAVPGAFQRAFIETASFTKMRNALTSLKCAFSSSSAKFLGLSEANVDNAIIIAGMGGDRSEGIISAELREQSEEQPDEQLSAEHYSQWLPSVTIGFSNDSADTSWKKHREKILKVMGELAEPGSNNSGGTAVLENPMEHPLGDKINSLFSMSVEKSSDTNGWLLSAHPLGGCVMADSVDTGVVNVHGQVYKARIGGQALANDTAVYENLAVIDGAMVPSPIDANPALSISALALHASKNLAQKWGWKPVSERTFEPVKREFFRHITPEHRHKIQPTELTLAERLVGEVWLNLNGSSEPFIAEFRLRSEKFEVDQFSKGECLTLELLNQPSIDCAHKLPPISELRLFRKVDWDSYMVADDILKRRNSMKTEAEKFEWAKKQRLFVGEQNTQLDELSVLTVPLSGTISIMEEVKINLIVRFFRGVFAWALNRGLRDFFHRWRMIKKGASIGKALFTAPSVFLHSGRERQFRYKIKTGKPTKYELIGIDQALWIDQPVLGFKRFFYGRKTNPINQLMAIELTDFPLLDSSRTKTLNVDLEYFADVQVPLFQIHKESDAVTGYADLIALGTWFSRISLLHYFWILRKPDTPLDFPKKMRPDAANTEPKSLPGLDSPTDFSVFSLPVADPYKKYDGETFIRLSRYRDGQPDASLNPVLCIHGFSLSWSMFAHETLYGGKATDGTILKGGLAAYLARKGHEVWVIDLRSSGSLPTAKVDWDFEEAALIDIPAALEYISYKTKKPKVDVVAHCMGAMKLSMLMMCSQTHFDRYHPDQPHEQYLQKTRNRIGSIALSQAGPYVRFSPANRLRERVISVLKNIDDFDLQFEENPNARESEEVMDRILNLMPYPENEFRIENPRFWQTRFWVRGRHRMDALYGQTFSLKNMDLKVLDRFHDFFGPMSFRMLEQVIWFSRRNQISSTYGGDYKLFDRELKQAWKQDTLWIHGGENQLLDPISTILTTLVFDEIGAKNFTAKILKNFGHQDCMMGKDCELPYSLIGDHFKKGVNDLDDVESTEDKEKVEVVEDLFA